jgi:hypothetical protein
MPQQPQLITPPQSTGNIYPVKSPKTGKIYQVKIDPSQDPTDQINAYLDQLEPGTQIQKPPMQVTGDQNAFQRMTYPAVNTALGIIPGTVNMAYKGITDPQGLWDQISAQGKAHGDQVIPDFKQGNYGDMLLDAAGSFPLVGGITDAVKKTGDKFSTGDFSGGIGELLNLALMAGGPKIGSKLGTLTENAGPAIAEIGLGAPASLRRNYGAIGRGSVDPAAPLSEAYTFPMNMRRSLGETERQLQDTVKPYDLANGPTVAPDPNIMQGAIHAYDQGKIPYSSTRLADEAKIGLLEKNAFDALPSPGPANRTLQEAIMSKRAEDMRANWSDKNTDNLDALFHRGIANAYRDSIESRVPEASTLLEREQSKMGNLEAYDRKANAPSNPLRDMFEIGTGLGTFATTHNPLYGLGATLGVHAMRSPNVMAGVGMGTDFLRRAILNKYAGGVGPFASMNFTNQQNDPYIR